MTELVARTFTWRKRVSQGLRDIPITVTWQHHIDDGGGFWVPVRFTIDGDGQRIGPVTLAEIPWSYVIASTDPDNEAEQPELDDLPARPSARPVNRRAQRQAAAIIETPPDLVLTGTTSLALFESQFGPRAYNALRRSGYHTLEAVLGIPDEELSGLDGVGTRTVSIIRAVLDRYRVAVEPADLAPEAHH